MSSLFINIILSIVTGVIAGIFSGLYTGIVSARYSAIEEIKKECLRVIRDIDYADGNYLRGYDIEKINRILLASSELLGMKQKNAGEVLMYIYHVLSNNIYNNQRGIKMDSKILIEFQEKIRTLPIKKIALLKVW